MVLERKTLYGVLEALDGIFSPDSTKFSDYVKETSDDNGFLRTAFCKKKDLLKDKARFGGDWKVSYSRRRIYAVGTC